jgi:hypothetical protein
MAEPVQVSGLGCLGRLLSFFGYAWVALTLFGGFAALEEFGINPGALGSIGGSIIPGFVLIAAGRALKKRGKVVQEKSESEAGSPQEPVPDQARPPVAKTPRPPDARPKKSAPVEPPTAPSRSLEEVVGEMESNSDSQDIPVISAEALEGTPKTSAEMIEEARHKWGTERSSD